MPPTVASRFMSFPPGFNPLPGMAAPIEAFYTNPVAQDGFTRHSNPSSRPAYYGPSAVPPVVYQQSGSCGYSASHNFTDTDVTGRSMGQTNPLDYPNYYSSSSKYRRYSSASMTQSAPIGQPARHVSIHGGDWDRPVKVSPDGYLREPESSRSYDPAEYMIETTTTTASSRTRNGDKAKNNNSTKYHTSQRRTSNRDEFDGPHQFLNPPSPKTIAAQERELPGLPTNLDVAEQDRILCEVNDRLSQCAYNFVAKYQFPIPIEPDKRQVRVPADREWTEWVYLLKRLATKRRIPARVLYNGQIKQLVTVLENSLEMRHAAKHQSRPVKDDRNVLQLISAGTQVAKILKDATAMEYLDRLYQETERRIKERQNRRVKFAA